MSTRPTHPSQKRLQDVFDAAPHLRDLERRVYGAGSLNVTSIEPVHAVLAALLDPLAEHEDEEQAVLKTLRRAKANASLAIALADRLGLSTVDETMQGLSQFADAAIDQALRAAFRLVNARLPVHEHGVPYQGLCVLAMGKLGARELNYSSDVDLIILFDAERLAQAAGRVEPQTFAVRIARRLVRLLQERTEDGFVFRTDLRLRPDPASTPLAMSIQAALNYYEAHGRTWERAAMIKARVVAGDAALGDQFLTAIQPFIWRRYLDFAAIDAIRSIKRRINAHKGFGAITVPGHDVKLGRGGIREIEFFAQTQQLLAGGRNPVLRVRPTKQALQGLADLNWIEVDEAETLCRAYDHLRNVEHCLQMQRDEQTHRIPQSDDDRRSVATLMDMNLDAFDAGLQTTFDTVHRTYEALFPEPLPQVDDLDLASADVDPALENHIRTLGFDQPADVHRLTSAWLAGRLNATATQAARARLQAVLPRLLTTFGQTDRPHAALRDLDRFFKGLPTGLQFFSMLESNPAIIELLARIMGTAPKLADTLAKRPRLFDALLDPRFFGSLPERADIRNDLARALAQAPTYEAKLNAARVVGQEHHFLVGVRLLSQTLTASEASAAYTALAEEIVMAMLALAKRDVEDQHGRFANASLTLLGMGKLGSRELTASSDLDLLLIYDLADAQTMSDGERPLAPSQYYTRMTQRLVAALSAPTAEGVLYEIDMRLRPSGNAGPLATSLEAFEKYQLQSARTWEHLALTRARPFASDEEGCKAVRDAIDRVLGQPRDADMVRGEVLRMRALIEKEKPADSVFDLKLRAGGIIDVEFVAQGLQLLAGSSGTEPIRSHTGEALEALRRANLLSADDADALRDAFRLYSQLSQILRLCIDGVFDPDDAAPSLRRLINEACDLPSLERVATHLEHTQADIRARFDRLFAAASQEVSRSSLGGDILEGVK